MKELESFTIGELEYLASSEIENNVTRRLARIALAAKTAEPVAWWTGPEPTLTGEIESIHDHETGGHYLPLISISTTSEAALSRETFIFKVANFLCTRRQSIAREAETASMIYDMVTTQVTERQKASIRDGISELRSHIESLGGFNHDAVSAERTTPTPSSPAIPDGWILLAEQKPDVGEEVIIGASDGSLDVAIWCGDHFDDGDYFDHITWPTHWKPAPMPPTTEK